MKRFYLVSAVFPLAGAVILACNHNGNQNSANAARANTQTNTNSSADTATPADELAASRGLYKQHCAECHKEDGSGGKVVVDGKTLNPENLTKDKFKKAPDERLKRFIVEGVPDEGMPAFKGKLNEEEIKQIVLFIRKGIQNQ